MSGTALELVDENGEPEGKLRGNANGAGKLDGTAENFVRHLTTDGVYNSSDVWGMQVLLTGTSTLRLSPKSGGADQILTASEIAAIGSGGLIYTHCDEIELSGGAGTSLLLFIG